jgi:hypothetical protein
VKERVANGVDPTKQSTLKVIEKLMEAPIIDPRQEKSYKAAATTVEHVKKAIQADLMRVVQMQILNQRVSELDAKRAMGLESDVDAWLKDGENAMAGAIHSGGVGCADSHAGLCAGVQVQGHCGIKDYAQACPLSCHRCAMPSQFKLKNTHETAQKSLEEKSSKAAVLKEKLEDRKKIAKASERFFKAKAKADKFKAKAKMLARTVGKMEDKMDSNQEDNEKDVKSATAEMQAAKAELKSTKEVVAKKKKLKAVKPKTDETPVKSQKEVLKDLGEQAKRRTKELKKAEGTEKKDAKSLKDLEAKKAKVDAAMAKLRAQKKELYAKKMDAVKAKADADRTVTKQRGAVERGMKTEEAEQMANDQSMAMQNKKLKSRTNHLLRQEGIARGKREQLELVSKAEKKRIQMFTVPGTERKVKGELMQADKDMADAKRRVDRYEMKFGHLGVKLKIPAKLEHAYAVAKQSKLQVEGLIKKLDAEQQSPAAQKLKADEVAAKGKFKKEEEEVIRLKKMFANEQKDVKRFAETEKKRRKGFEDQKKKDEEAAKKIEDASMKVYKKDVDGIAKSEKKVVEDQGKVAKDSVSPSQILDATEILERDRNKVKDIRKSIRITHHKILKAKGKLGTIKSDVAKAKEVAKNRYATEKAEQAQVVAEATARKDKAEADKKTSKAKLKGAEDAISQVIKLRQKMGKAEKGLQDTKMKEEVADQKVKVAQATLEAIKRGEPALIEEAKEKGVEAADKKIKKKAKKKKAEKKKVANKKMKGALSASTKAMLTVAQAAMEAQKAAAEEDAEQNPPNDEKCTGSEDMHPRLCSIIQNHNHCGYGNYKDYCCGACAGVTREMGDAGTHTEKPNAISKLEAQLGHSIAKASSAIAHAHRTEMSSKESLPAVGDN